MEERDMLVALHEAEGIGWQTIRQLVELARPLTKLAGRSAVELAAAGLRGDKATLVERALRTADTAGTRTSTRSGSGAGRYGDIRIVTRFDPDYPVILTHTPAPPWVLYCRGRMETLVSPAIAIVGSRTPTAYGKRVAEQLAEALADRGFTVVSGLARGIDGAAHRGSLRRRETTIAVLGTAIDVVYPPEHRALYEQIADNGLIVSEYGPGTVGHPGLFPLRNRIIAGLCSGTVIVEAAAQSGSLITADHALDADRDVFAVPGPITSPKSAGALELLRRGAYLAAGIDDILFHYPWWAQTLGAAAEPARRRAEGPQPQPSQQLTDDERAIYELLSRKPVTFDYLLAASKAEFGHLHAVLLSLSIKSQIEQLPGALYRVSY